MLAMNENSHSRRRMQTMERAPLQTRTERRYKGDENEKEKRKGQRKRGIVWYPTDVCGVCVSGKKAKKAQTLGDRYAARK